MLEVYRDEFELTDAYGVCAHNIIQTIQDIQSILERLSDNLSSWIISIKTNSIRPINLIEEYIGHDDNAFITFNYTNTLEVVYGIDYYNICYVHGSVNDEDQLVIGHGALPYERYYRTIGTEENALLIPNERIMEDFFIDELYELDRLKEGIHEDLRKNTSEGQNKIIRFISNRVSNINRIISYGFSYGEVDHVYFRTLIELLDGGENIEWLIHDRRGAGQPIIMNRIKDLGFRGKISTFT